MTTLHKTDKRCALCGKTSEHTEISSTNAFGPPDLDTRPPEMKRSTITWWIQTCPSCGYCAPDLSELIEKAAEKVSTDAYQQQLHNPEYPASANAFRCFSFIQESAGEYRGAGRACIHAAWLCDDSGADDGARDCRKKAVTFLQKARESSQHFGEQSGAEEALLVDLLRRSGQFEPALRMCDEGLKKNPGQLITSILQFQQTLIHKSDAACHTIAEVK
jgi:hypothetical protein